MASIFREMNYGSRTWCIGALEIRKMLPSYEAYGISRYHLSFLVPVPLPVVLFAQLRAREQFRLIKSQTYLYTQH